MSSYSRQFPCSYCDECDRSKQPVPGDGPLPCDLLFIGEAPGDNEDKNGIPFCGITGYELNNTYLRITGRKRHTVRVSNAVRCRPDHNKKPSAKLVASCSEANLRAEIAACRPCIIVLMGATACSLDPSINLTLEHGFPRQASFLGWSGTVVPMFHPASGLHDGNKMTPLLDDFTNLRDIISGRYVDLVNDYPDVDYRICTTARQLENYIAVYSNRLNMTAVDTEGHDKRAFSIQICREPGTGLMLMCDNKPVVQAFVSLFPHLGDLVFHFSEHDLDFLQGIGCDTYDQALIIYDTMRDLYNTGNLPQGLKAASYRTMRTRMRTWEDVVLPHSKRALDEWLERAITYAEIIFSEDRETVVLHKSRLEMALGRIVKLTDHVKIGKAIEKLPTYNGYYDLLRACWRPPLHSSPRFNRWLQSALKFSHEKLSIRVSNHETHKGKLQRVLMHIRQHAKSDTYKPWDRMRDQVAAMDGTVQFEYMEKKIGECPVLGIGNVPLDEAVQYAVGDADMTLRLALELENRRGTLAHAWEVISGDEDQ